MALHKDFKTKSPLAARNIPCNWCVCFVTAIQRIMTTFSLNALTASPHMWDNIASIFRIPSIRARTTAETLHHLFVKCASSKKEHIFFFFSMVRKYDLSEALCLSLHIWFIWRKRNHRIFRNQSKLRQTALLEILRHLRSRATFLCLEVTDTPTYHRIILHPKVCC